MKHLGQRYVHYINRKRGRTGTLWEGRYRSCLTQTEYYVLTCYRYIEYNPVRAGITDPPHDYPWSSHRANAEGRHDRMIKPHNECKRLGRSISERCAQYRALFRSSLDPAYVDKIRQATNGNHALGSSRFKAYLELTP